MESLKFYSKPQPKNPPLILGFSGWMDGGYVSTGTIHYLKNKLKAKKFAEIDARKYYIFNFPGAMTETAQFRPYTQIKNGVVIDFQYPQNEFFYDEKNNLVLFQGKEPNFNWDDYAHSIFALVEELQVNKIYFAGSVAGPIPHTREVRISYSLSNAKYKKELKENEIKLVNYEGPASFVTLLLKLCAEKEIEMITLVAEIPIYIQARNHKAIKAVTEKLIKMLNINIDFSDLSLLSANFEKKISEMVRQQPLLTKQIKKLEENYDKEFFEEKGGFEEWLKKHGIDKL